MAFILECLASTKPNPGTPWIHLLALLIKKSMCSSAMSMAVPPKLLMASTMKTLLCLWTISPISVSGLSMPVVVSQ